MTEEEAKNMCIAAIEAGVYHDLGSGSNVDVCIIKKGKSRIVFRLKCRCELEDSFETGYLFDAGTIATITTLMLLVSSLTTILTSGHLTPLS